MRIPAYVQRSEVVVSALEMLKVRAVADVQGGYAVAPAMNLNQVLQAAQIEVSDVAPANIDAFEFWVV